MDTNAGQEGDKWVPEARGKGEKSALDLARKSGYKDAIRRYTNELFRCPFCSGPFFTLR